MLKRVTNATSRALRGRNAKDGEAAREVASSVFKSKIPKPEEGEAALAATAGALADVTLSENRAAAREGVEQILSKPRELEEQKQLLDKVEELNKWAMGLKSVLPKKEKLREHFKHVEELWGAHEIQEAAREVRKRKGEPTPNQRHGQVGGENRKPTRKITRKPTRKPTRKK
jgi:hypothetical protein